MQLFSLISLGKSFRQDYILRQEGLTHIGLLEEEQTAPHLAAGRIFPLLLEMN